jgi:hypothetical protein
MRIHPRWAKLEAAFKPGPSAVRRAVHTSIRIRISATHTLPALASRPGTFSPAIESGPPQYKDVSVSK